MVDIDCSLNRFKQLTTEEWLAEHTPHGQPEKKYNCIQPPGGYKLYTLWCPCGAGHMAMEFNNA
jgi:hypothetical protein